LHDVSEISNKINLNQNAKPMVGVNKIPTLILLLTFAVALEEYSLELRSNNFK
jgi:hypothetical protein